MHIGNRRQLSFIMKVEEKLKLAGFIEELVQLL